MKEQEKLNQDFNKIFIKTSALKKLEEAKSTYGHLPELKEEITNLFSEVNKLFTHQLKDKTSPLYVDGLDKKIVNLDSILLTLYFFCFLNDLDLKIKTKMELMVFQSVFIATLNELSKEEIDEQSYMMGDYLSKNNLLDIIKELNEKIKY